MGAQLRVYRQKIKSAQTTKKITRAMELISASRIQKAQARVAASSPYARAITRAVSAVATYSNVEHVLTTEPEKIERAAIVIFSSDRGLAGAFNSNVLKESEKLAELLRSQDIRLADEIRNDDDDIDELHASVFDKVLGETWKGQAVDTVDATLASRYHERFADHAVSIAKKVQYLATGDWAPELAG